MKKVLNSRDFYLYLIIFGISFIYFAFVFNLKILNPLEIDWQWKGTDPVQHYLGWAFFRKEPWHWPPGLSTTFNIAQPMSVGLTDSLPLLAFLFKPFSSFLPDDFQYFGFYIFLNIFLQGIFAFLLSKRYTENPILQILFTIFLILSPILLLRLNVHVALASHWILLAAIYDYPRDWHFKFWIILTALSALIHPYLMTMLFGLLFFKMIFNQYLNIKIRFLHFVCCAFFAIFLNYLSGQFVNTGSMSADGFGAFSANLLSFLDTNFISQNSLTPIIFFGSNRFWEGSQYLGFGMILLLLLVFYLKIHDCFSKRQPKIIIFDSKGLWLCVLLLAFFALGSPIYFVETPLFEVSFYNLPLIYEFANMFRACGRFAWPFFYVLNIFILAFLIKRLHPAIAILVLFSALVFQIVDLSSKYTQIYNMHQKDRLSLNQKYFYPYFPNEWQQYAKENADMVFISKAIAIADKRLPHIYETDWPFYSRRIMNPSYFAYKNKMQSNHNFSRWDADRARGFMFDHWERLKAGKPVPNTLYVFLEDMRPQFLQKNLPPAIYSQLLFQNTYHILPIQGEERQIQK